MRNHWWQAGVTKFSKFWESWWNFWFRLGLALGVASLLLSLNGCSLPQVSAEERLFLSLQIELLDVATLPKQTFADVPVGGLSSLTYDPQRNVFYALSDDRGELAAPRFYTLDIQTDAADSTAPTIASVTVQAVTLLKDAEGRVYERDRLDPEGMVLSPRQTVIVASEGIMATQSPPALNEYDLATGVLQTEFRLPQRLMPAVATAETETDLGVRDNLGIEALT
ncbi:MAG: esterase-like activity of phytase family protein, partial [Cyanobacteria bacterium P01_D01_bin.71]